MSDAVLFDLANQAWDAGNFKEAFALFSEAAANGHVYSENSLGYFYDHGIGVAKNPDKAFYWYRRAARGGDVAAIGNVAICYRDAGNLRRARWWFAKAVAKGDGDAALDLAKLLLRQKGRGVKQARKHLKTAARSRSITPAGKEEARKLLDELDRG